MRHLSSITVFTLLILHAAAQVKTRTVDELISTKDAAWPVVRAWIDSARNRVEILAVDAKKAKEALYKTQVTTRSPMGAIVYMTGGLLVDNGWIRILGSGHSKINRTLPDWNRGKTLKEFGELPKFLLVADDVIGGFFAINGGALGKDSGKVYYLAPDNLKWEPLNLTYSGFLLFCFNNDLNEFYTGWRWANWKREVAALTGNEVYNFYPPLWSKEGKDITNNQRKAIPIEEQYTYTVDTRKQLGIE